MDYFKKVLPVKKQKLAEIYSQLLSYLKSAKKGLKMNNVEEVQWWLGDVFTLLCENKEIVDPVIYTKIVELKNDLMKGSTKILFFHTCFKGAKRLEIQMQDTILAVNNRLTDLQLYLQNFSG